MLAVPRRQCLFEVLDVLCRHAPEGRYGRGGGRKAFATRPGEREVIDRMKVLREGGLAVDKIAAAAQRGTRKSPCGPAMVSNQCLPHPEGR